VDFFAVIFAFFSFTTEFFSAYSEGLFLYLHKKF
jgi:hypothetical protein